MILDLPHKKYISVYSSIGGISQLKRNGRGVSPAKYNTPLEKEVITQTKSLTCLFCVVMGRYKMQLCKTT